MDLMSSRASDSGNRRGRPTVSNSREQRRRQTDTAGRLSIYSLTTRRFTRLYDSEYADKPIWLNDGRRLLFDEKSKLVLIDSRTHATREVMSIAPDTMQLWSPTRDNRTIYFVRHVEQADIWLMRSK